MGSQWSGNGEGWTVILILELSLVVASRYATGSRAQILNSTPWAGSMFEELASNLAALDQKGPQEAGDHGNGAKDEKMAEGSWSA